MRGLPKKMKNEKHVACQDSRRAIVAMNQSEGQDENPVPKHPYKKREAKYIQPIVANYKRNKRGVALVRQELKGLLVLQGKKMPSKAMMDCEGKTIEYQYQGRSGSITVEKFLLKGGEFFDAFFVKVRKKVLYGSKVQAWIQQIDHALGDYKLKPLQELVAMIDAFEPVSLKGYVDQDVENEEDPDEAEDVEENDEIDENDDE